MVFSWRELKKWHIVNGKVQDTAQDKQGQGQDKAGSYFFTFLDISWSSSNAPCILEETGMNKPWHCPHRVNTLVKKSKVCGSISNSRGKVRSSLEEWPTYPTAWGTSSLHCPAGTAPQHRTTRTHISCHTHPFQFNEGWLPPKRTAQIISAILLFSFILTPNIPVTQPCQSYFSKVSRIHRLLFLLLPLPSPGCHLLLSRPF